MLEGRQAVDLALALSRAPALSKSMQAQPLPPDVLVLIRIAAGAEETARSAAESFGLPRAQIREASVLFLQKVLFAPDSDSYRVLGLREGASRSEARTHMRWLMQWLHPDQNPNEWESVFAERVLSAWRALNAEERSSNLPAPVGQVRRERRRRFRQMQQRWVEVPVETLRVPRRERIRFFAALLAGVLGIAAIVLAVSPISKWPANARMSEQVE